MVTIEIDGQKVQLEEGDPILKGAEKLEIRLSQCQLGAF